MNTEETRWNSLESVMGDLDAVASKESEFRFLKPGQIKTLKEHYRLSQSEIIQIDLEIRRYRGDSSKQNYYNSVVEKLKNSKKNCNPMAVTSKQFRAKICVKT